MRRRKARLRIYRLSFWDHEPDDELVEDNWMTIVETDSIWKLRPYLRGELSAGGFSPATLQVRRIKPGSYERSEVSEDRHNPPFEHLQRVLMAK